MLSSRAIHLDTDGRYFPMKTPGKGLKNRAENAIHPGAMTVQGKGKNVLLATPFHPSTAQPKRLFKDPSGSQPQLKPVLQTRPKPLGDKTPFPNHVAYHFQTPLPNVEKPLKLSFLEKDADGNPLSQRPSSTRKHSRPPRSASRSFETPLNQGNHWDVSDVSIVMPDAQETIVECEDDFLDEVEYGPPNTLDLAYQPPLDFDLPDYKVVGQNLRSLAFSVRYDDSSPAELDVHVDEIPPESWNLMPLPDIASDDPFDQARQELAAAKAPKPVAKPVPAASSTAARAHSVSTVAAGRKPTTRPGTALSAATSTTTRMNTTAAVRKPSNLRNISSRTTPARGVTRSTLPARPAAGKPSGVIVAPSATTTRRPIASIKTVRSTIPASRIAAAARANPVRKPAKTVAGDAIFLRTSQFDEEDFVFDV
ncbi:hypothetical protein BDQ12DRAFT_3053 [Crucibulum laeve]|uniref:Uncharacterized protein n=1 Tax=Crucibulum laeve TaxID=68775 RepID=A0A5C3MHF2_9AGAR|nr:hypothetical protein BDQ12DRAFT_3053 [Crucibulum laeve]